VKLGAFTYIVDLGGSSSVIRYGRWCSIALRWVSMTSCTCGYFQPLTDGNEWLCFCAEAGDEGTKGEQLQDVEAEKA